MNLSAISSYNYNHCEVKAVDGDWFNTTALTSGPVTVPGPGNLAAIRSAVKNQFNWVADLAENVQEKDALALILYADQAAAQFDDHFDIGPVLDSINLDFPIQAAACETYNSLCRFNTFKEAVNSIGDVINEKIVKAIQFGTSSLCPAVRDSLSRALATGVPARWTQAL